MDQQLVDLLRDVLIAFLAVLIQELRSIKRHDKNMQATRELVSTAKEEVKSEVVDIAADVAQTEVKHALNGGAHSD